MTDEVDVMRPALERITWTIEETATLLGLSRASAYEAARRGEIPTIRLGKRLLVPRAALEDLLREAARRTGRRDNDGSAAPRS